MAECYISKKDWKKILDYAQASYDEWKAEIGGMAVCYKDKDGDWILTQPVILKQVVSGSSTSLDKTELAKYYTKIGMKWSKYNTHKEWRFCWWHSHHNMGAFWSRTDTDTIDEYEDGDLSFALVVCLNGEYKFRVSMWQPFVSHQDVTLNVMGDDKHTVPKKIKEEVLELCDKPESKWEHKRYIPGYTSYQTTLWTNREEEAKHKELTFLEEKQGTWQDQLIDGELIHSRYINMINNLNADLEKRGSVFRLKPWGDPINDEEIYTVHPFDSVFEVDKDGKPVVKNDYVEELDQWNDSFGVV